MLLQDENKTPAGDPQTSSDVSNGNITSTAAASEKLVTTKETQQTTDPIGGSKVASKNDKQVRRKRATTKRKKKQDATSVPSRDCQKIPNKHSAGSGDSEWIFLEECGNENQDSFTDLEQTPQLNKSDYDDKEISSAAANSRSKKSSVSARMMAVNERHDTAADLECCDAITESLMTTTHDEKHHKEDSTLPINPKLGSDGEFETTPNEENPSQGDLELMTKGKESGCLVPVTANDTPCGKMHQLQDETSDTEEPGGSGISKAMKRLRGDTSSIIPKEHNPYKCDKCGKVMSNFKNYKSHVKSHTVGKAFECSTCGKLFRERWDLNKHVVIHSTAKPFMCEVCGQGFNRRYNLELHLRVHTGEKPFKCDTCDKSFRSCVNLKKHFRIHTGEKPYTCKDCRKEFSDSSAYKNHLRVHSGEKPFNCNFCKRTFATSTTLKRHTRTHTGEKPYQCSVCEKVFGRGTDLKGHLRIHTGERPYSCTMCGKTFSSWLKLHRHKNIHVREASRTQIKD